MHKLLSAFIASAALFAASTQAATVTLNPTADAYVEFGAPTVNYGVNTELRSYTNTTIGGNLFESYLKFDASSASGQIIGAKLRLYAALSGSGSVASNVQAVANTSWGETAITWNNKPALGTVLGGMSTTSISHAWKEIDVTAYVQSEKAAGRNVIGLDLRNLDPSSVYVRADSREAGNPPQLVIVSNDAPTVSLTSPANGASFTAPASVTLSATASDTDGSIAKVEFYQGNTLLYTDTTAPYDYPWANVPAGSYTLTAKAYDDQGASTAPAPVTVSVNAGVVHGVYYIYADHLNTPRVITDNTNKVVWRWDSDPFGSDAANEDPDGDGVRFGYNLRFPGQYYDKETGLHYNYFRDYDPGTGRYVQSDPIGLKGGINTYAYANNSPLWLIDPLGLAYFAKRPLAGMPWLGPASSNPIDDFFNTEISHEQLFFEDGKSPSNIGFFDDGTLKSEPNPTGYRTSSGKFNDCIMRKAVANTGPLASYCLVGRNCQTWAERVRAEYARLAKDPKIQEECEVCKK